MITFILADFSNVLKHEQKLVPEFVVKINDRGPLYTEGLINMIKKHKSVNDNIKKLRYGNYLVFVKDNIYRENNEDKVLDLDLPIYKITDDYSKVEKLVNNFFKNVYSPKTFNVCDVCPLHDICPFGKKQHKNREIYRDGDYIEMTEQLNICNKYVSVGYDIYRTYTRGYNKYVNIEGTIFQVKQDRVSDYLELV
jgi:hypothetical protein